MQGAGPGLLSAFAPGRVEGTAGCRCAKRSWTLVHGEKDRDEGARKSPPASLRDHSAGSDPEGGLIFFISGGFLATIPIAVQKAVERASGKEVGRGEERQKGAEMGENPQLCSTQLLQSWCCSQSWVPRGRRPQKREQRPLRGSESFEKSLLSLPLHMYELSVYPSNFPNL